MAYKYNDLSNEYISSDYVRVSSRFSNLQSAQLYVHFN